MPQLVDEVTDVLQQVIRNACVNDGRPDSGEERKSVDLLESYLEGSGADLQRFESAPGRASLVARLEGSDPDAPSLLLMGHTDVVPVNPDRWRRDPFAGELVEGEVWGRGAVDMLNETASQAVAFRRLAQEGFKPKGTLIYFAVADEEALGTYGAGWMVEHELDAVRADYVITESGGFRMPLPSTTGIKLPVMVGEKGTYWCRIRVKGTPGHGSMPLRTDNALVKAAEVVRRIAEYQPQTNIIDAWKAFVHRSDLPPDLPDTLLWDSLQAVTEKLVPGATTIPFIIVGATDARFFRRAGMTAYGAGLFSDRISFAEFAAMFHGDDERIDQESLRLSTDLWLALAHA